MPGYIGVDTTSGAIVKRYYNFEPMFEPNTTIIHIKVPRWWNALDCDYDLATNTFSDKTTIEQKLADAFLYLRTLRNAKLSETDWTQLSDIPETVRNTWVEYRQKLRDLPSTVVDPMDEDAIPWPEKPVLT